MLILDTMINPSIEFNFTHYHIGEEASWFAQTSYKQSLFTWRSRGPQVGEVTCFK